jgi:uncharacterized membrane protein
MTESANPGPTDHHETDEDVRLTHEHNEPDAARDEGVRHVPAVQAGQGGSDHSRVEAAPGREPAEAQPPLPEVDNVEEVQQLRALIHRETTALWSAPLPDPDTLQSYEDVVPGAGDRILKVYESQTVQVSDREDRITAAQTERDSNGQGWAMFLSLVCVIAAIVFGFRGQTGMAGIMLGVPAVMLIGSFIPAHGKKQPPEDDPS